MEVQKWKIISCWGTGRLPRGGDFELNFKGWGGFGNTDKGISKQSKHTESKLRRRGRG